MHGTGRRSAGRGRGRAVRGGAAGRRRRSAPTRGASATSAASTTPRTSCRVDGTPFVLVGRHGHGGRGRRLQRGPRRRPARYARSSPRSRRRASAAYPGCPGPPDPAKFTVHGIDLKTEGPVRTVYAVNHGGRESIEVFRLDASDGGLALTWIGCALLPDAARRQLRRRAARRRVRDHRAGPRRRTSCSTPASGARPARVLRWSAAEGWKELPDVAALVPQRHPRRAGRRLAVRRRATRSRPSRGCRSPPARRRARSRSRSTPTTCAGRRTARSSPPGRTSRRPSCRRRA